MRRRETSYDRSKMCYGELEELVKAAMIGILDDVLGEAMKAFVVARLHAATVVMPDIVIELLR